MKRNQNLFALQEACDLLFPHNNQESAIQGKILMLIAQQGNCTTKYLEETLQVNQSTISRETRSLGRQGDRRKMMRWEGRGLIQSYPDPADTRRFLYELTSEGNLLVGKATRLMQDTG